MSTLNPVSMYEVCVSCITLCVSLLQLISHSVRGLNTLPGQHPSTSRRPFPSSMLLPGTYFDWRCCRCMQFCAPTVFQCRPRPREPTQCQWSSNSPTRFKSLIAGLSSVECQPSFPAVLACMYRANSVPHPGSYSNAPIVGASHSPDAGGALCPGIIP